jgi:hypothetical protein
MPNLLSYDDAFYALISSVRAKGEPTNGGPTGVVISGTRPNRTKTSTIYIKDLKTHQPDYQRSNACHNAFG